jgi:hypothetical protein
MMSERRCFSFASRSGSLRLLMLGTLIGAAVPVLIGWSRAQAAPNELTIRTVPALKGIEFQLDDRIFVSNHNGKATISVVSPGTHALKVLSNDDSADGVRAVFSRWTDLYDKSRPVTIAGSTELEAGFDVSYRARTKYITSEGIEIDPEDISGTVVKSSTGAFIPLRPGRPEWLKASRVVRRREGFEPVQLVYSVKSVLVDGSNVVNHYQQKFQVKPGLKPWTIRLLYFPIRFDARDVLLDTPVGSHVLLEFPDGSVRRIPLDDEGRASLPSVPRGEYKARVDASGYSPIMPISISKKGQEGSLIVVSYADMGLVAAIALICALGPYVFGRRRAWQMSDGRIATRLLEELAQNGHRLEVPSGAGGDGS